VRGDKLGKKDGFKARKATQKMGSYLSGFTKTLTFLEKTTLEVFLTLRMVFRKNRGS
jgi:hypothetical protein